MKNCNPIILGFFLLVTMLFLILVVTSCTIPQEDITIYGLLKEDDYIKLLVQQYNQTQKKYLIRYRKIEATRLRDILENNVDRKNLFLLVTTHRIIIRATNNYLEPIIPNYKSDIRELALNWIGKSALGLSRNYGYPLYVRNIENEQGVDVIMLGIPIRGYNDEFLEPLLDVLHFFSQADINVQSLKYSYLPVYKDASKEMLPIKEQGELSEKILFLEILDDNLQPKQGSFQIAP